MRNRLLPLFGMAFVAAGAYAQDWTAPVPALQDGPIAGVEQYIYNVEANKFMTMGNTWSTQTSVADRGSNYLLIDSVTVVDGEIDLVHTGWVVKNMDPALSKGDNNRFMFIASETQSYQDHNGQGHNFFEFVKQPNGYYRIHAIAADPNYGEEHENWGYAWFGVSGDLDLQDKDNASPAVDVAATEDDRIDWAFVTPEEYAVWEAKKAMYNVYEEGLEYEADFSAYEAIYNNPAATVEEMQAAVEGMKEALAARKVAILFEGASEADPKDGTPLIENPNFDGNINGWDCTFVSGKTGQNVGYQGASYTNDGTEPNENPASIQNFIEAWTPNGTNFNPNYPGSLGDAELCQTIKYLPAGKYSFACDCIAVDQNNGRNPVTGVQLYAIGGELDTYISMATRNNQPQHFELEFIHSGGDITIGLRTRNATANWIAADNFTLMYYGKIDINPFQQTLMDAISRYEEQYEVDALHAQATELTAWEAAVEAAKDVADTNDSEDEVYKNAKAALEEAAAKLQASIDAYVKLAAAAAEAREKYAEAEAWPDLQDQLGELKANLEEAYTDGTYDVEQCEASVTAVSDMITDYVSQNAKDGDDVTILINNPGFATDFSRWQVDGRYPTWNASTWDGKDMPNDVEGKIQPSEIGSGVAEVYGAQFDVHQSIKNMPAGLYTLQCQAFERQDNGDMNGQTEGLIYAIINGEEQNTPLKSLRAESSEEPLFQTSVEGLEWQSDSQQDDGTYVPNGMAGANVYFYYGYYANKFNFLLEEAADIKVGIKTNGTTSWILFDNFKLVYQGNSPEAWQTTVSSLAEEATALLEANAENSTVPAQDALGNLIDAAQATAEGTDAAAMHDAFLALRAGMEDFRENIKALNETEALYDLVLSEGSDYYGILSESDDYAKLLEAYEALEEVVASGEVEAYSEMTTAEIRKFIADAKALIAEMKDYAQYEEGRLGIDDEIARIEEIEGWDTASDEAPLNVTGVLVNADLNDGGAENGWNLWGNGGNCVTYANAFGISGNTGVECWNPNGLEFDFNQQLFALPEGTYTLGVDAANSQNGVGSNGHSGRAYIYVEITLADWSRKLYRTMVEPQEVGCNDAHANYKVDFKVPEGAKRVTVGAKSMEGIMEWRWFMVDNFTLTYYGKNSEKNPDEDAIAAILGDNATETKIYSLNGVEQKRLMKGVNIVKTTMADGTIRVNKILVR